MRISQIYNAILKHFTNKESRINILFYLSAGIVIWYLFSFKVLITLILMLVSVFVLTSFLLALYMWLKAGFKGIDKDFVYSLLYALIVLPFVFFTLDKQLLGYVLALSAIGTGIGIYRTTETKEKPGSKYSSKSISYHKPVSVYLKKGWNSWTPEFTLLKFQGIVIID